jgi:hypothetical protein
MRLLGFAVLAGLLLFESGFAQQAGGNAITAEHRDIGKLQTRVEKSDQALGVVIQLVRPGGANVECNGVCYLPSSSKPVAWKCAPATKCDLHCVVNPATDRASAVRTRVAERSTRFTSLSIGPILRQARRPCRTV